MRPALMTIDFEDYRRQELRDHLGTEQPPNPDEVEHQLNRVLSILDSCKASATFFSVGRLTEELTPSVWARISRSHDIGCHSHEHERVRHQGPKRFEEDLERAKKALEDRTGKAILSYRAPYFSVGGCDPWYGEILSKLGFRYDSSRRLDHPPDGFQGTVKVPGGDDSLKGIPMPSVGMGEKRLTVIGGTYFRVLPLRAIESLLRKAEAQGFIPMVYLHPYDFDPYAERLAYPRWGKWKNKLSEQLRRAGRSSVGPKLEALARSYQFQSIERLIPA